jgi:hypothetical protein
LASRHQKGKRLEEVKAPRQLLIVLGLLIIVGLFFIIIVVIVTTGRSIRGAYAKGG